MNRPGFGENSQVSFEGHDNDGAEHESYSDLDCKYKDIESIRELQQNLPKYQTYLSSIRIINSDYLKSMRGLSAFPMLKSIVLSANQIEKIEDISNLKLLIQLDLSCNRIRVIVNLQGLPNLHSLDLSGNRLVSMLPLCQLTSSSKLQEIDLSGNSLQDLSEISKLVSTFPTLRKLNFQQDEDFSNPFCEDVAKYTRTLQNLAKRELVVDQKSVADWREVNPQNLTKPDDKDRNRFEKELQGSKKPNSQSPSRLQQTVPRTQLVPDQSAQNRSPSPTGLEITGARFVPKQPLQPERPPQAPAPAQSPNPAPLAPQRYPSPSPAPPQQAPFSASPSQQAHPSPPSSAPKSLQTEFARLLQQTTSQQTALEEKDKQLNAALTERKELEGLVRELEHRLQRAGVSAADLAQAATVLRSVQREKERTEILLRETLEERDGLRGQIESLKQNGASIQKRLEDVLVANVQLGKEVDLSRDELGDLKSEFQNISGQLAESRRIVKGLEASLATAHSEALKNTEISIIRIEDMNARLREQDCKVSELKQSLLTVSDAKNVLFEEKTKLEITLNNSLETLRLAHATELSNVMSENRTKLGQVEASHSAMVERMRHEQEEALNSLEEEYKKIMTEANEKHKKVVNENKQLREALHKSVARNQEIEGLLLEMGGVVEKVKKEREKAIKQANLPLDGPTKEELLKTNATLVEQNRQLESDVRNYKLRLEEYSDKIRTKDKEIGLKDELITKLQKDVQGAFESIAEKEKLQTLSHNEVLSLQSKLLERDAILHRITAKLSALESGHKDDLAALESQLETQSAELGLKSHLLREKSEESDRLKTELDSKSLQLATQLQKASEMEAQHRQRLQEVETEYARLQHKYSKKDGLLDEYEEKIELLQTELRKAEEVNRKLKGDILSQGKTADECLERLRILETERQRDGQAAKEVIVQAEEKIQKLNSLISRKEARILELENGILEVKGAYTQRLTDLQNENKSLRDDCGTKEREIRTLIFEIDRQKAAVKENLAGLTRIFS